MTTAEWDRAHRRGSAHPMDSVAYIVFRSHLGKDFVLSGRHAGAAGYLARGGLGGATQLNADILTQATAQGVERYTGNVVKRSEYHTKIRIDGDSPEQFWIRNAEWWRHQSISQQGWLMASTIASGLRIARVRLGNDTGDPERGGDPGYTCSRDYPDFYWQAEDPYIRGPQLRPVWTNKAGAGAGRLLLPNPGDYTAYPEIVATGPGRWSIQGDDGQMVPFPHVPQNDAVRIFTDRLRPGVQNARRVNLWAQMGGKRLRLSVPPGEEKTIRVEIQGGNPASSIMAVVRPLYGRLW